MVKRKTQQKYSLSQIARLKSHALKLWKADTSHAIELGNALLAVRKALRPQHGAFKKWWQQNHLVQARVSYCMDIASGKLENRRKKSKSTAHVQATHATQFVSAKLNKLFKTCAQPHHELYSSVIPQQLREAIGATLMQAAKLAGWQINKPEIKHAAESVDEAVTALIAAVSASPKILTKAASAK